MFSYKKGASHWRVNKSTGEKQYSCSENSRTTTGEKRVICTACDAQFEAESHAMELEKLHMGGKQFIYPVCNHGYKKIQVLKDHQTNHNETVTLKGLEDYNWWGTIWAIWAGNNLYVQFATTDTRKYKFWRIIRRITTRPWRQKDSRTTTGEERFICTVCDAQFVAESHAMEHEKLHKGGKQFICSVCNRGYKKIQVLKDHPTNHNETVTSKELEDYNWWGTIHLYGMWRTICSWISRDGTRKTA